jgi:pimeloyl-ACP methyl ester carboxylesterase/uncharacterized membrane protein YidH (DUF202 family)
MKLTHFFRLRTILAFLAGGLATLFFSILLETFLFRPIVKSTPGLFPWNRELNALSLILASIIAGAAAVQGARSFSLWTLTKDKEEYPTLLVVFAAAGVAVTLWLLRRVVADNPLTVGWRGIMIATAGAATGGTLVIGGRSRWIAIAALLVAVIIGFGTVDYDYYTYPVAIPSDRVLLRGEISVPGRDADATYPGVVLVHDWGQQDRDATWGVNQPFRELAEHLARNGYVVLRYDKRGSGASTGVFTQFGLDDFATDAAGAGALLAAQDSVHDRPVFAVGHGYGGQAATIAAGEHPDLFAGLALLNTPSSPTADFLPDQKRRALSLMGAFEEEIASRVAAVDDWLEGVRGRRYLNYGDYFGSGGIAEDLQAEQIQAPLPPAWVRQAEAHNQTSALIETPVPVLIVAGDADWRVPTSEAEALADALAAADRSDWDLVIMPGMNHQLVAVDDTEAGFRVEQSELYKDERLPVAPALLDTLTDWLNRMSKGS